MFGVGLANRPHIPVQPRGAHEFSLQLLSMDVADAEGKDDDPVGEEKTCVNGR